MRPPDTACLHAGRILLAGAAAALIAALVRRRRRETSLTEEIAALRGRAAPAEIDAAPADTPAPRTSKLRSIALSA